MTDNQRFELARLAEEERLIEQKQIVFVSSAANHQQVRCQ